MARSCFGGGGRGGVLAGSSVPRRLDYLILGGGIARLLFSSAGSFGLTLAFPFSALLFGAHGRREGHERRTGDHVAHAAVVKVQEGVRENCRLKLACLSTAWGFLCRVVQRCERGRLERRLTAFLLALTVGFFGGWTGGHDNSVGVGSSIVLSTGGRRGMKRKGRVVVCSRAV